MRTDDDVADRVTFLLLIVAAAVFVPLFLLPTRVFAAIGEWAGLGKYIDERILFADQKRGVKTIQQRILTAITDGAERLIAENNLSGLPVSRHCIEGQLSVQDRNISHQLDAGETVLSLLIGVLSVTVSVLTLDLRTSPELGGVLSGVSIVTVLSIGLAMFGVSILLLTQTRLRLTRRLLARTSSNEALTREELLSRYVWNQMVAEEPAMALRLYYLVYFAGYLSEAAEERLLSILRDTMDPAVGDLEAMSRHVMPTGDQFVADLLDSRSNSKADQSGK